MSEGNVRYSHWVKISHGLRIASGAFARMIGANPNQGGARKD
jgi:hypothetical protein